MEAKLRIIAGDTAEFTITDGDREYEVEIDFDEDRGELRVNSGNVRLAVLPQAANAIRLRVER